MKSLEAGEVLFAVVLYISIQIVYVMIPVLRFYTVLLVTTLLFSFSLDLTAQTKKQIALEDIWQKGTFTIKDVPGFNALSDGKSYTQLDDDGVLQEINIYDLEKGRKNKTLLKNNTDEDANGAIVDYTFSNDEQKILLFTEPLPVYRRSVLYKVWVCDLKTGKRKQVDEDPVMHATFNPQGTKVAFVKSNNLYIRDLQTDQLIAVTTDGVVNKIINGNCDWVYEEEFEFSRAYQWSPDGNYLAYYRFDESQVKEYTIPFYDSGNYPRLYTYKYPKAGELNSEVGIYIYDLNLNKAVVTQTGDEKDQYIPRIRWSYKNNELCIYRLNRLQNKLDLLLANAATGDTRLIYSEENKYYIEINDNLLFLPDGFSFVFTSEREGYNRLYRWNWEQQELLRLTDGAWDVKEVLGIDEKKACVYYTAAVESPMEKKLYQIGWNGKSGLCLTPQKGTHDITPCAGFRYFLDKYSSLNNVPVFSLIDNKGKKVRVLEDNKALQQIMDQYALSTISTLQILNDEGELLNAWMIKPADFDPAKKYPVLLYQYSGPGSQEVRDRFPIGNYFWHQMMAQNGYIIVCADGTGTGGRGEKFKKKTYLQLGKYESDDQIAVGKYMVSQNYVDNNRIGIWGWSYGGFMSSTCILKGADVFKTAVAVAPVTNWRFYDNIYTERYMRTPQQNQSGYDDNAPERMADRLKGNLLIIHGTADDNVHFQNAAVLTDKLIKANKQFESEYYPNKNHGIYGGVTRLQLFRRITDYLLRNL